VNFVRNSLYFCKYL